MQNGSIDDCKAKCDEISRCKFFHYNNKKKLCYMNDKVLTGSEPMDRNWKETFTVYKSCVKGTNK